MNGNRLHCGEMVKYKGEYHMILGFSGGSIYYQNPNNQHKCLVFPEKITLNRLQNTIYVPYGEVVNLSRYSKPKF